MPCRVDFDASVHSERASSATILELYHKLFERMVGTYYVRDEETDAPPWLIGSDWLIVFAVRQRVYSMSFIVDHSKYIIIRKKKRKRINKRKPKKGNLLYIYICMKSYILSNVFILIV